MIVEVYPEINWDELICRDTVPHHFWSFLENRRKFLDSISINFKLKLKKIGKKLPSKS